MSTPAVLVKNADRMMTSVNPVTEGIELTFADGCTGVIPYADIPEIDGRTGLTRVELPTPYKAVIWNSHGETAEIPWDFARHYCDPSYRSRVETVSARGRVALGGRIRQLRGEAGMTQQVLARAASIGRVTLLRIEKGEQSPTFKTLLLLADALGKQVQDLIAPAPAPPAAPYPPASS